MLVLLLLTGCMWCGDAGPGGVEVKFLVDQEGTYTWTMTGDSGEDGCSATIPDGTGILECSGAYGPEEVDGGGWRFGSYAELPGDPTVHVTLSLDDGTTVLDTDFAPEWGGSDSEECAQFQRAEKEFDVRDGT
jgi:hypothetical protein